MDPATTIERLKSLDVDAASPGELSAAARQVQSVRGFLDSFEGRITRRANELQRAGSGVPAEDLLARGGRSSRREAEKAKRRGETLEHTPELDQQLAKGHISTEHADVVASIAERLDEGRREELFGLDEELAVAAASKTPEAFRRFVRRRADQLSDDAGVEESERQREAATLSVGVDDSTGMGRIIGTLHPDDHQQVQRAIDGEVKALKQLPEHEGKRRDQLNAIALVNLVIGARSHQRRKPAAVVVHIDHETMVGDLAAAGLCEYSDGMALPPEAARRLACDSEILPAVLGGDGMPLDVGRARRLATPEQRAALRAMYRTCAIDGCERHFDRCEAHHLIEWETHHGPTDLENLLPLCSYHHHRAHEGRWRLELDAQTRELTVWLPDGTMHSRCLPDIVAERAERDGHRGQSGDQASSREAA